jgi:parvulin-like peptidyl-prolyl isomerase
MHQNMEKEGITEESLQTECLQMARQQYWLQVVAPQLVQGRVSPVSQEETEEFKTAHPNDWMKYESIRVSHILLRVPEGTPAAEEEKIKEKAETISLRAQAGEDFAVLAREFSQHEETRGKGGSLGEIRRAETFPEFDPLFDLLLGKPSAPIRTKLGYHIALVSERISLPDYLRRQKSQQALNDWVEEIVNRSETEILYKGDVRQDLLTDSAEGTERP